MEKWFLRIFLVILAGCIFITCSSFFTGSGEQVQSQHKFTADEIEPENSNLQEDGMEYIFSANEMNGGEESLIFYTSHQFVTAYVDGELVYSLQAKNKSFGNTPGSLWNFVNIPYGASRVVVQLQDAYPERSSNAPVFLHGLGREYQLALIKGELPAELLSTIILAMGLVMLCNGVISYISRNYQRNSLVWLGLFATTLGFWSTTECELANLIIQNQQAVSFSRYILLMLIGLPFIVFVKTFLELPTTRSWKIMFALCLIWIPLCISLQLFQVCDFKRTVFITHCLYLCLLIYLVVQILKAKQQGKQAKKQKLTWFFYATFLLLIAVMINIYGFYQNISSFDAASRTAAIVYMILVGYLSWRELEEMVSVGKKAEIYRTLAVKDVLTGMYNRNAYIDRINQIHDPENMMIITFDLNNLKQCNDNQGHMYGDRYIIASAAILENVFSNYGECYRIGGDEFCVVISNAKDCNITKLLDLLEEKQQLYNQKSEDIFMQIAHGYAAYEAGKDRDIEATRSRADEQMYEHKRQLKAKTGLGR